MEFSTRLIQLIHSYISNSSFTICSNRQSFQDHPITVGVPLCSMLWPFLFSLYINDMHSRRRSALVGYNFLHILTFLAYPLFSCCFNKFDFCFLTTQYRYFQKCQITKKFRNFNHTSYHEH